MRDGVRHRLWICVLVLLPLPAALALEHRAHDPLRYYSMARVVAESGHLGRELKERFVDDTPIVVAGTTEFPPLYPLLAALALRLVHGLRALQVFNVFLIAAAFLVYARVAEDRVGPGAGLLVVALWIAWPGAFWLSAMAWTEALAILVMVGILAAAVWSAPGPMAAAWIGSLLAVAYLVRPELVLLAPGLAGYRVAVSRQRGARRFLLEAVPLLVAGAGLTLAVVQVQEVLNPGRVLSQSFLLSAWTDTEAFAGQETLPSLSRILADRELAAELLGRFAAKLRFYAGEVALHVGPAAAFGVAVLFRRRRRRQPAGVDVPLVLLLAVPSALLLLAHAAIWSIPVSIRYVTLPLVLLLPLAAAMVLACLRESETGARRLLTAMVVLLLAPGFALFAHRSVKSFALGRTHAAAHYLDVRNEWADPWAERAAARLAEQLPPDAPVAAANPWLFNYLTGNPSVVVLRDMIPATIAKARRLPLRAWVDSPYLSEGPAWPGAGARTERVGPYVLHFCGPDACAGRLP